MRKNLLFSLIFLSLFLFFSPSLCADFQRDLAENSGEISLKNKLCSKVDDNDTSDSLTTIFSNLTFEAPSISSTVTFQSQKGDFPFSMSISYTWETQEGESCPVGVDPVSEKFESEEDLNNFVYVANFEANFCLPLMTEPGPFISCIVSFCALDDDDNDIKFTATMASIQQETLFDSDTSIKLPGPKLSLQNTETGDDSDSDDSGFKIGQQFSFMLSKEKGTFSVTLDNVSDSINKYFSALSVSPNPAPNPTGIYSLEDVDGYYASIGVDQDDSLNDIFYFILVEANNSAEFPGTVEFAQGVLQSDTFPLTWVVSGAIVGVIVFMVIFIILFLKYRGADDEDFETLGFEEGSEPIIQREEKNEEEPEEAA